MYSCGPPHLAGQKQGGQHEHTFSNYVRILDVVRKTCLRLWTIGKSGERGLGISMLPARYDDVKREKYTHTHTHTYIYIYICIYSSGELIGDWRFSSNSNYISVAIMPWIGVHIVSVIKSLKKWRFLYCNAVNISNYFGTKEFLPYCDIVKFWHLVSGEFDKQT